MTDDPREIVVSRVYDAPRELVFQAWTDRDRIGRWWGPNGFTTTTHEMDVRPGGVWRFMMHGPDGTDYPNRVRYSEVSPPERLVYVHDSDVDDDPREFHTTVTFEERGGKTSLTMRTRFASAEMRDYVVREIGAIDGANQTLGRLAGYLGGNA
jgi:uncharacterized protein YndB with AHSA1/START domain